MEVAAAIDSRARLYGNVATYPPGLSFVILDSRIRNVSGSARPRHRCSREAGQLRRYPPAHRSGGRRPRVEPFAGACVLEAAGALALNRLSVQPPALESGRGIPDSWR